MTNNSYIAQYISEHHNWRSLIGGLGIIFKEDKNLCIFNYSPEDEIDWCNPVCREARGIIINTKTYNVVCWPFEKFFNHTEKWASEIDWNTAKIQEKVDGSLIKLWFYDGEWRWSTNRAINAKTVDVGEKAITFFKLITFTREYQKIDYDKLNKDYTYMFELVSPENRVEVSYAERRLFHIATRSNIDGHEVSVDIGIPKPNEYEFKGKNGLDYVVGLSKTLNRNGNLEHEGFVVVDDEFRRIKVKTEEYLLYSRVINNGSLTKKRMVYYVLNTDNANIDQFCDMFPEYTPWVRYYQFRVSELLNAIDNHMNLCRRILEEYDGDRKALALEMKNHPLNSFTFIGLDNKTTAREFLDCGRIRQSTFNNLIEDYEPKYRTH